MHRDDCLQQSVLTGGAAGLLGAAAGGAALRSYSARAKGSAGAPAMRAFWVCFSFFLPFMFVSNVARNRCQKAAQNRVGGP